MLVARGAKRDTTSRFKIDRRLEILADDKLIGELTCDLGATQGTLTLGATSFTFDSREADTDECLSQLLAKNASKVKSGKSLVLMDASGRVLGLARQVKSAFFVSNGQEAFELRKLSTFARPYHLYRIDSDRSLGWAGQRSFFGRTLEIDLPSEFDTEFQVFILVLSLHLAAERAAKVSTYY
jgi:hypothetical protein